MSITPQKWYAQVTENYGSIAAFHDKTSVLIIREKIETRRADLKVMIDAAERHPGAVSDADQADINGEDAELARIDAELVQWLESRKKKADLAG